MTRRVKPVSDSEVEDLIANRQQQYTSLDPGRGTEIEDGRHRDRRSRRFVCRGTGRGPIKAEDLEIPLGDEVIEKAFTENLVDVEQDEEKAFTVAYPEDFSSKELAGKTVDYKAKIKSVGLDGSAGAR